MNTMSRQVRRQIHRYGELRTPGFEPVASQKLNDRLSKKLLAHPAPRMVRSTGIKPSRSDDFFYRNPHLRNA